jgi:cytoskeletal protein CcmA (bactofilin family)
MAESGDTTVVGADSHFKGELSFERTAKIIGKFDGKITGKGELQVSQNATCKADVDTAGVQVDGTIEGNVNAKDTVKLNSSGAVRGDITAAKMVMSEGASFHGVCAVGPDTGRSSASAPSQPSGPAGGQPGQPPKK